VLGEPVARFPRKNKEKKESAESGREVGCARENADVDKKKNNSPEGLQTAAFGDYNTAYLDSRIRVTRIPGLLKTTGNDKTIYARSPRIESTLGKYIENTRK